MTETTKVYKSKENGSYYWIDNGELIHKPIEEGDQFIDTTVSGYPVEFSLLPEKEQDKLREIKKKFQDKKGLEYIDRQQLKEALDEQGVDMNRWYEHSTISRANMAVEQATDFEQADNIGLYFYNIGSGYDSYTEVRYHSPTLNHSIVLYDSVDVASIETVDDLAEMANDYLAKAITIENNISYDNS